MVTGPPRQTQRACRSSTQRPRSATRRCSSRRLSPTTPRGTPVRPLRSYTLQNFFGTDKIGFSAFSNKSAPREGSSGSPTRSRRSSMLACGPASTSAPPTCKVRGARQQSCPLPQEALLPASPRRPIDQSDSGNCKPSTDWSSSTAHRPQPRGVAIRGFPQVSRHFRIGSSNPRRRFRSQEH